MKYVSLLLMATVAANVALGAAYVPGEVLAGIPRQYLRLPNGATEARLDETATPESLQVLLLRYGVKSVEREFPHAEPGDTLRRAKDGSEVRLLDLSTVYLLRMSDDGDVDGLVRDLASSSFVTYAEPNYILTCAIGPNDTRYGEQWALDNTGQGGGTPGVDIRAENAWDITTSSPNIRLGMYDTGIDPDHTDFSGGKIAGGKNYEGDADDLTDGYYHGTFTSGLACARTSNSNGIAGVAGGWGNGNLGSQLWVFRLGMVGFDIAKTARAIQEGYSVYDIDVMNFSFGVRGYSFTLRAATTNALTYGCVEVACKGNNGSGVLHNFPSDFGDGGRGNVTISVGALTKTNALWEDSNYGHCMDFLAPGADVLSTMPTYETDSMEAHDYHTEYEVLSGTSASAPIVSGAAALLLSLRPELYPDDIAGLLQSSATDMGDPGYDDLTGYGRLNVDSALRRSMGPYYVMHQHTSGGSYDHHSSDQFDVTWPFGPDLRWWQNGWVARYHEVRQDITFPYTFKDCRVWGKNPGTLGTSLGDIGATPLGHRTLYLENLDCPRFAGQFLRRHLLALHTRLG